MMLDFFQFDDIPARIGIPNSASVLNCDIGFIGCVAIAAAADHEVAA